jgi:hypothetical protein
MPHSPEGIKYKSVGTIATLVVRPWLMVVLQKVLIEFRLYHSSSITRLKTVWATLV